MKAVAIVENTIEAATVTAVVILTNAWSVLEALTNNKAPEISQALNRLSITHNVALQWIPVHSVVAGNEQTDKLAKEEAQTEQPNNPISYREKFSLIKYVTKPKTRLPSSQQGKTDYAQGTTG